MRIPWGAARSPVAEQLSLEGTEAARTAVPMGVPLMRVDTGEVRRRLEADRTLRDIHVSRRLPETIVIEGTPRVAVLAVRARPGGGSVGSVSCLAI